MSAIASQQQSGANMMSGSQKSGLGSQKPENEYDVEGEEDFEDEEDDEKDGESSLTPMILGGIGVLAVIGIIVLSCMFCRPPAQSAAAPPAKQGEAIEAPGEKPGDVPPEQAPSASMETRSPASANLGNKSVAGSKASVGSPKTKIGGVVMLILTGVAAMVIGMMMFAGKSLGPLSGSAGGNAKLIGGLTAGAGAAACVVGSLGAFTMRNSMRNGDDSTETGAKNVDGALAANEEVKP